VEISHESQNSTYACYVNKYFLSLISTHVKTDPFVVPADGSGRDLSACKGCPQGGADAPQRSPSRRDGGKEGAAGIHPLPLPTTPADPTAKEPQISGSFITPEEKAGFLPMHISKLSISFH